MASKDNPYESLVAFINRHEINPQEEKRLRDIIKQINDFENKRSLASVSDAGNKEE